MSPLPRSTPHFLTQIASQLQMSVQKKKHAGLMRPVSIEANNEIAVIRANEYASILCGWKNWCLRKMRHIEFRPNIICAGTNLCKSKKKRRHASAPRHPDLLIFIALANAFTLFHYLFGQFFKKQHKKKERRSCTSIFQLSKINGLTFYLLIIKQYIYYTYK